MRSVLSTSQLAQASSPKELPYGYNNWTTVRRDVGSGARSAKGPEVMAKWVEDVRARQANESRRQSYGGTSPSASRWPQAKLDMSVKGPQPQVGNEEKMASVDVGDASRHAEVAVHLVQRLTDTVIEDRLLPPPSGRTASTTGTPAGRGSEHQGAVEIWDAVNAQRPGSTTRSVDPFWESSEAKALVEQVKWLEGQLASEKQTTAVLRAEKSTAAALLEAAALQVELTRDGAQQLLRASGHHWVAEGGRSVVSTWGHEQQQYEEVEDDVEVEESTPASSGPVDSLGSPCCEVSVENLCWQSPEIFSARHDSGEEVEDNQEGSLRAVSSVIGGNRVDGCMWRINPLAEEAGLGDACEGQSGEVMSAEASREEEEAGGTEIMSPPRELGSRGGRSNGRPPIMVDRCVVGGPTTPVVGVVQVSARRISRLEHAETFSGVENLLFETESRGVSAGGPFGAQAWDDDGHCGPSKEGSVLARLDTVVCRVEECGVEGLSLLEESRATVDKLEGLLDETVRKMGELEGRAVAAEGRASSAEAALLRAEANDAIAVSEAKRVVHHLNCVETEIRSLYDTLYAAHTSRSLPPPAASSRTVSSEGETSVSHEEDSSVESHQQSASTQSWLAAPPPESVAPENSRINANDPAGISGSSGLLLSRQEWRRLSNGTSVTDEGLTTATSLDLTSIRASIEACYKDRSDEHTVIRPAQYSPVVDSHESLHRVSRWAEGAARTLSQQRAALVADLSALRVEVSERGGASESRWSIA